MSYWWKDLPCPFHPTWELGDVSECDLRQLKQNLDVDDDESMVVETAVYRAFLEFPRENVPVFFNQPRDGQEEARKHLILAKTHVKENFEGNIDAEIGYGIVINTFQMYIEEDESTESILRALERKKGEYPLHQCYVDVVQAYILSRLGPRRYKRALSLFNSALENFDKNCDWLLGKALLIGREARELGYILGWKNKDVLDLLNKERIGLKSILALKPDYHLARALHGQVLKNLGKDEDAMKEISQALKKNPPSHSVAMVAARFYRKIKDFEKARNILEVLRNTYNTAETHFQLGTITIAEPGNLDITNKISIAERKRIRNERTKVWNKTLQHFENCLKLNSSHYPCKTRLAEVKALLGETQKARDKFLQLLEHTYKKSLHLHRNEMMTLDCALRVPKNKQFFFIHEIIKYSHRYVTLVVEENATIVTGVANSNDNVKERLKTLQGISRDESKEKDVRRLATLKLADANRLLKRFEDAKTIYETLLKENKTSRDEAEIIWGLGKCYLGLKLEEKVISMAERLEGVNQTTQQFTANELYADAYLSLAKSRLGNKKRICANNLSLYKSVKEHLKQAIKMGSLEASYSFLNFEAMIKKYFFSLEFGFPEILAHIKLLCGQTYKEIIIHTQFSMKLDDGSEEDYDETKTKSLVMKKLNNILKYEYTNGAENLGTKLYEELEKLRAKRLEFEVHLLGSKDKEWDEYCRGSLIDIIPTLRDLLDQCISFYMETVLSHFKGQSMFPVKFDKDAGKVNEKVAKKKLDNWIKETFGENRGILPEEVIEKLLKVQPMYDSKNNWLAALHFLNIKFKHKSKLHAKETFDLCVAKPGATSTWKSEDIVRISCQEVESFVLYFLSKEERS